MRNGWCLRFRTRRRCHTELRAFSFGFVPVPFLHGSDDDDGMRQELQRLPGVGHPQRRRRREVRDPQLAGNLLLTEEDLLLRPVRQPPVADPPFQRPPDSRRQIRMILLQLVEQVHSPELRIQLQQRHNLLHKDPRQWVRTPATPAPALHGRRPVRSRNPIPRCTADPGSRRGNLRTRPVLQSHEQLPLLNGNVAAGHGSRSPVVKETQSCPPHCSRQQGKPRKQGRSEAARRPPAPLGLRPPGAGGRRRPESHLDCR